MGTAASVLAPLSTGGDDAANWRSVVNVLPWTGADRSSSTEVTYEKNTRIGVMTLPSSAPAMAANQSRTIKYVYKKTNTTGTGNNFAIPFGTNSRFVTSIPTGSGYFYGTIQVPGDLRTIDLQTHPTSRESITLSNIVFYTN